MTDRAVTGRVARPRLVLFAAGDFAFNLYWQSATLYLLFYYTDALGIDMATAATLYLAASLWDGIASFAVGALVDRHGAGARSEARYRLALMAGSVPLGLAFVAAYAPPPLAGTGAVAVVLIGHIAFRTAYALVNIPYIAMSARISPNPRDRAFVAGLRMLFGTAAGVTVAIGTVPAGSWLAGTPGDAPAGFLAAALLFAAVATATLALVGARFRAAVPPPPGPPPSIVAALQATLRNRAFAALIGAMMAMIVASTILSTSVLYYYKYVLADQAAGQLALASMMAISAVAVPLWMLVGRLIGLPRLWLVAVAVSVGALAVFAVADVPGRGLTGLFLIVMQAMAVGMHFAFWAMLPDTIEWGQRATGLRAEGTVVGLAALLQRVAIGIATLVLGLAFGSAGYAANTVQSAATLADMRTTIALVPLGFFVLSGALMWVSPLRRS